MDRDLVETCYAPAAMKALTLFPVDVKNVELVSHAENVTFRVSVHGSDTDYSLRLHRPGYNSITELNSERTWARALLEAGMSVPDSLLASTGEYFVLIDVPGVTGQCYAGMTTWIEGAPLSEYLATNPHSHERQRIYQRIGEIAATIHNQSTCWEAPPGFERQRLDLDGLLGEAPRWGRFWEHSGLSRAERKLLLRARKRLRNTLGDYGERPGNFSLIHADLHPANIIYNDDDLALIDFDDSAYGWHMYEFASALIECHFAPGFDALSEAMIKGYRKHRPLAERDVEMLPDFLLLRGMAIIGWLYERPEHGETGFFEDLKNWVIAACEASDS